MTATDLITLEEIRGRFPVNPRTGKPPSMRYVRELLQKHGCCLRIARITYVSERQWQTFLERIAAPPAPAAPVPARPAPKPRLVERITTPEEDVAEARALIAKLNEQRKKKRRLQGAGGKKGKGR